MIRKIVVTGRCSAVALSQAIKPVTKGLLVLGSEATKANIRPDCMTLTGRRRWTVTEERSGGRRWIEAGRRAQDWRRAFDPAMIREEPGLATALAAIGSESIEDLGGPRDARSSKAKGKSRIDIAGRTSVGANVQAASAEPGAGS